MRTHGALLFWWLHPASLEGGPLSKGDVHGRMLGSHTSPPGSLEGWPPGMGLALRDPGGGGVWKTLFCVRVGIASMLG